MYLEWWALLLVAGIVAFTYWKLISMIGYINIKINTLYSLLDDEIWRHWTEKHGTFEGVEKHIYGRIHQKIGTVASDELEVVRTAYKKSPFDRDAFDWKIFLSLDDWARKNKEKRLIDPVARETLFGPSLLDAKEFEEQEKG